MRDLNVHAKVYINYTLHVTYLDVSEPTIWVTIELLRNSTKGDYYFPVIVTKSLGPGEDYTVNVTWYEENTMDNGIWKISLRTDPIGTAGGEVYDVNTANNKVNSPYQVTVVKYVGGDLGGGTPPKWYSFTVSVVVGLNFTSNQPTNDDALKWGEICFAATWACQ
jgi:hypothetical protein